MYGLKLVLDKLAAQITALLSTDPVQVFSSNSFVRCLDDTLVKTGAGTLVGFGVGAAGTAITVTFYDGTSTGGTALFGPYTLVAGAVINLNAAVGTGIYADFSATTGTPNITVFYR